MSIEKIIAGEILKVKALLVEIGKANIKIKGEDLERTGRILVATKNPKLVEAGLMLIGLSIIIKAVKKEF